MLDEIKVQKEVEVSTNLWIPLSSLFSQQKPWHTSFVMALAGPPFYTTTKGVD